MVIIESCKALCELKNISNKDLTQPITVLSIFLIGSNTVNKYAALKIINKVINNIIFIFNLIFTAGFKSC